MLNEKTVETVVFLSQQKPDDVIEVELELDELDLTSAESYPQYILTGMAQEKLISTD